MHAREKNHGGRALLVIGLGNPGTRYENTYHNAGRIALEWLRENAAAEDNGWRTQSNIFEYRREHETTWVRPLTFMNESGKTVERAAARFRVPPERILVLHDDSDLSLGVYKLSFNRSSGGHKGVQSIIDKLGTSGFWRGRVGVRRKDKTPREKAGKFVLGKISACDLVILKDTFAKLERALYAQGLLSNPAGPMGPRSGSR